MATGSSAITQLVRERDRERTRAELLDARCTAALAELRFWLDYVSRNGGYMEQWVIDRLNHNRALIAEMEGQR